MQILNRWQCLLKQIWRTIMTRYSVDGCDYVDIEEYTNCKVIISKCEVCGKTNITWEKLNE